MEQLTGAHQPGDVSGVSGSAGTQAGEQGTNALSTRIGEVASDGADGGNAGVQHLAQVLLGRAEVVTYERKALGQW